MTLLPIAELNQLLEADFANALRPLFEAALPLERALFAARPFTSYAEVIDRAESSAAAMPREDQIRVLSAHPRIGADPATVSESSYREQGYDAEAAIDRAELERIYRRLEALNRAYEERFGFRFVVFVNQRPKSEIVEIVEDRLNHSRDEELRTGLRNMFLIARARLAALQLA